MQLRDNWPDGVEIRGSLAPGLEEILTTGAVAFIAKMERAFRRRRADCLRLRHERQARLDAGESLDFLSETKHVRDGDWTCASIPEDLRDRRVEITGPTDRKMVINALNSGAKMFMADCEDSMTPTWDNVIGGQVNLRDAVNRTIELDQGGKHYQLNPTTAALLVRPRGWHLYEKHMLLDGKPIPGAFVDFGLYLFHNHASLKKHNTGP